MQKFALHHTLKKFADFTEVLWFGGFSFFTETGGRSPGQFVVRQEGEDYRQLLFLINAVRMSKFKDFENLHIQTRFDFPYFKDIADEYDFFVVSSDQVWNSGYNLPYELLDFVPREKKISYAASIGTTAIPDEKKKSFKRGISDFNYLSVREESAIKVIKDLTGRDSILLIDPVLLLTADEWPTVAQKPTWFKERYSRGYVLTYHLSKLPLPVSRASRKTRLASYKFAQYGQLQSLYSWSRRIYLALCSCIVCFHEFISRHGIFNFI